MKVAFLVTSSGTLAALGLALAGPHTLRPTMAMAALILFLMSLG